MKPVIYYLIVTCIIGLSTSGCEKESTGTQHMPVKGQLVKHTSCKDNFKSASIATPDSLSCIDYSFDGINKLTIKHINAGFNCCPERLWCEVSRENDTIIVREFEKSALCDCDCLYDLDIEITEVSSKKYFLKFVEPYCREQQKLFFEIDLTKTTAGTFCVTRKQYPWGIYSVYN